MTDTYVCTYSCILYVAVVKSPLGGDFITMQCRQWLEDHGIEVIPPYLVASKEPVKELEKPKWTRRANMPEVTMSWHNYMVKASVSFLKSLFKYITLM